MRKTLLSLIIAVLGVVAFTAAPVMASHTKNLTAKVHKHHKHKHGGKKA